MSVNALIADLAKLGIRLEANGDRLRFHPRSAVTPDLAQRMKAQKQELLEVLRAGAQPASVDDEDATAVWHATLDQLEGNSNFPPTIVEVLREAEVRWSTT